MSEEKKKAPKKPKSKGRKITEWILTGIFLVIFAILGIGQIDALVHQKDHHGQQLKFGFGTFVVQTESMDPDYKKGDALVTQLQSFESIYKEFQKGKTIDLTFYYDWNAYNEAGMNALAKPTDHPHLVERIEPAGFPIITHRVMEIHVDESIKSGKGRYTFIAAGINNSIAAATDDDGYVKQYQSFTEQYVLGRVVVGSAFLGGVFSFVSSVWGLLILLLIPAFYLIITSVIDIFKAYKEPEEETASANAEGGAESPKENKGNVNLSEADKKRLKEQLLQEMLEKKKGDNK